ncbi:MAG: regulator SirB [Gammaproteobacteria bacterium]|nr:MAG: regulator SirB [Gammaproteobacteria bacterium]RKZ40439.1 MAG: regulator SirB [Gammaproteobacteria bacterium]RKZ73797.1 MAG: regulator SirB [Gammaproteobacteria bacterium]
MYPIIKNIHVSSVVLTFLFFFQRGIWMLQDNSVLQQRWVKILPIFIDTTLLLSGITLIIILHQYPGSQAWLSAKLIALLIYIIIGSIALKRGKTKTIQATAFLLAIATFFYLVSVALTQSAIPFLVWF